MADTTSQLNKLRHAGVRTLVGWSALLFGTRVLGAAAAYASQVAIARWFGADVLGQYVIAFSLILVASLVATGGFAEAAPRFVGLALNQANANTLRGYVRRASQVTVVGGLVVSVIGAIITWLFVSDTYQAVVLIAFAFMPCYALLRLNASFAQGFAQLALRELPNSIFRPALFFFGVACCFFLQIEASAEILILLHGVIIVGIMIFMVVMISRSTTLHAGDTEPVYNDRLWLSVVPSLAVTGAFYMFLPEIINLLVSFFLGATEIAHLNAAMRTGMLVMFVIHAIDSAFLPRATHLLALKARDDLASWVLRAATLKVLATAVATVVFLLSGEHILGLFGEEFRAAQPSLIIFACGFFLRVLIAPPLQIMILGNQQKACVRASLASLVVLICSVVVVVPLWGLVGASVSAVLSMLAWGVVLMGPAKSSLGFHPAPLAWVISRYFAGR